MLRSVTEAKTFDLTVNMFQNSQTRLWIVTLYSQMITGVAFYTPVHQLIIIDFEYLCKVLKLKTFGVVSVIAWEIFDTTFDKRC